MRTLVRMVVGSLASLGAVWLAEPFLYFEGQIAVGAIAAFAIAGALAWLGYGNGR